MATEKSITRVLDMLTTAPVAEAEALGAGAGGHASSIRRIIASPNVVGVGIAEKISDREPTGKLSLVFYVAKKIDLSRLKASMMLPATVPEALSGSEAIPCDVIPIGKIVPEVNPMVTRSPVQPGFSIGHVQISAGTLGAVVSKGGKLYLLSNSHVLSRAGLASRGDDIVYPGPDDGGTMPADLVAKLTAFVKFKTGGAFVNRVDCAIALPTAARLPDLVSDIKNLGVPSGTVKPVRGMKIIKVGRTTRKTRGVIRDVNFRTTITYAGVGDVGFLDQVLCSRYSKPGDSGSLVLEEATGKAVGLHFAGANGGSVFNPIDDVLAALGVKLVTKPL